MAVPTITSISPARGHSGGHTLVEILGTNFRLPAEPPPTGKTTPPPASVRVFIGGVEAKSVGVVSPTRLLVVTNPYDLPKGSDERLVDVEVRNVGPFGEQQDNERVLVANAFTYARPKLDAANESNLTRMVRTLIRALKRDIIEEVVLTQNTDWDDDPADTLRKLAIAKLPAIYLVGPRLQRNRGPQWTNVQRYVQETPEQVLQHRAPYVVDLVFTIGALSDNALLQVGLVEGVQNFPQRNPWLYLQRSPDSDEVLRYEVCFDTGGDMDNDSTSNASNVYAATGTLKILAFDLLASPGFDRDMATGIYPTLDDGVQFELNTMTNVPPRTSPEPQYTSRFIVTEDGDFITTESGDLLIAR